MGHLPLKQLMSTFQRELAAPHHALLSLDVSSPKCAKRNISKDNNTQIDLLKLPLDSVEELQLNAIHVDQRNEEFRLEPVVSFVVVDQKKVHCQLQFQNGRKA